MADNMNRHLPAARVPGHTVLAPNCAQNCAKRDGSGAGKKATGRTTRARLTGMVAGCAALTGLGVHEPLTAQAAENDGSEPRITLGLGPGVRPEYEGADEYRPIPIVVARARFGARYFVGTDGEGLQADVVGLRAIEAGPSLSFKLARNNSISDDVIARLPSVDQAIEVGGFLTFNLPFIISPGKRDALSLTVSGHQDVTNAHGGHSINVTLRYRGLVTRNVALQMGPFATYASRNFMQAYYGVTAEGAARSGLPEFSAHGGWKDVGFKANAQFMLTDNWNFIQTVSVRRHIGDALESPVIDQRGSKVTGFAGIALAYSF